MTGFVPYAPDDFDAFWQETEAEASSAPLDFSRQPGEFEGRQVDLLTFRGISGEALHGWVCATRAPENSPAFLWIAPYGRESMLPNEFGTREGMVSMSFNFFGHEAFHQEKYVPERGYFSQGAESPQNLIFRAMYQNASIAARVLAALPEVDSSRLGAMGMSQGAGISIWLGAWCNSIKAVCADMPFLGAFGAVSQRVYRYPLKEVADFAEHIPGGMDQVRETFAYFDTMNQATRCYVPTHVSLGLKDPAAKPETVRAIYEALAGPKELIEYDWGHDWHPEMIDRNRAFLLEQLP